MGLSEDDKLSLTRSLSGLAEEVADDGLLYAYLGVAQELILTRRNPFSDDPTSEDWEPRYDRLQCEVAAQMLLRRGAEGEVTHTENGISRQYTTGYVAGPLLARVVPKARAI